jgi:ATP-dependent DNA helicase RecQ
MSYLQVALDDPAPSQCGRCSVCTGDLPDPGSKPSSDRLRLARDYLQGVDIIIEPRKLWPTGCARKGKIAGLGEGRAVAFADDPGWSEELLSLQRVGYGIVGTELLAGAVETLRRWSKVWPSRPIAVAAAPAFSVEMAANRALAAHIGAIGKLPVLDLFEWVGEQLPRDTSSGPIVSHLERSVQRNPLIDVPRGPIMLCAASMRSGWTLAVCAAVLDEENKASTMPLVIHRLP